MKVPFAFRLAAREARSTVRRLGAYTVAIAAGIAALVAINSFRAELVRSVADESRGLLGADLRISSGRPLPDSVQAVVDSATAAGVPVATVTGTVSVALAPSGLTRLVQVRGVEGAYPFYGAIVTEPAGLWGTFAGTHDALVDPSLLLALEARVGDSLRIGQASFRIAGTLAKGPVELGPQSLIAPRVWISRAGLADAGLIQFGSLVTYRTFLRIPDADALQRFGDRYHDFFRRQQVRQTTAEEQSREIGEGFEWMTRFLGLIGLTALLLGGLGVASAVNVFVKQKRATIATLRCLGATPRTAFLAYLLQAALLGLIGSIAGIMVGLVVQAFLPAVFGPMIPVDVHFRVNPLQLLGGLAIGVWVATVFALLPLLEVRTVSPLQALRHDVQPEASPRDPVRWAVVVALIASVAALAVMQAPMARIGFAYTGALLAGLAVLRGAAALLMKATRRWFPHRATFVLRQGVGNLFRPANQTAAVIVALGFGVYLIAANWTVQTNLLETIRPRTAGDQPDLVAFDIQPDQTDSLAAIFAAAGAPPPELVPIVPARIVALRGKPVDEILNGPERTRHRAVGAPPRAPQHVPCPAERLREAARGRVVGHRPARQRHRPRLGRGGHREGARPAHRRHHHLGRAGRPHRVPRHQHPPRRLGPPRDQLLLRLRARRDRQRAHDLRHAHPRARCHDPRRHPARHCPRVAQHLDHRHRGRAGDHFRHHPPRRLGHPLHCRVRARRRDRRPDRRHRRRPLPARPRVRSASDARRDASPSLADPAHRVRGARDACRPHRRGARLGRRVGHDAVGVRGAVPAAGPGAAVLWLGVAGLAMLVGTLSSRGLMGQPPLAALRETGE